jgi:type VI protein secretion system component VasF
MKVKSYYPLVLFLALLASILAAAYYLFNSVLVSRLIHILQSL